MFGYTLIEDSKLEKLNQLSGLIIEQNNEINKYVLKISKLEAELLKCKIDLEKYASDCYAGVWCGNCKYCGFSEFTMPFRETYTYPTNKGTYYCKKHIKKICKEYEE